MAIKIMIDRGHDGTRNQSPVYKNYYESVAMWKLGEYLTEELVARGFVVGNTRSSLNQTMDVVARGKASKGFDLFLSLHSNACGTESVDRASGIYLATDNTTNIDEISKEVALGLTEVVKNTMGNNQNPNTYYKLAGYDRNGNGITTDDDYYGVLYGAHIVGTVGIILEHSFHTNTRSAKWLYDENNLKKLAKAEADWLATYYNMGTVAVKDEPKTEVKHDSVVNTVSYTVKKGDTLGGIALKFSTTVDEIMALNPIIRNKNLLSIGWTLTIPTANSNGTTVETYKIETVTYTVKSGDTLGGIASKYGVTVNDILAYNPSITNPNLINKNQKIIIPTKTTSQPQMVEYIVKKGDTLGGIVKQFGTTVAKLVLLNGIKNASKIYVGQVIKLK